MQLAKKIISFLLVMIIVAGVAKIDSSATVLLNNGHEGTTAGATATLREIHLEIIDGETGDIDPENEGIETVNPAENHEADEWTSKLMANVEEKLNVRATPEDDGELTGKLRRGDVADILETTEGWYKITSGNVEGYVNASYCVTGADAYALSKELCKEYATSTTDGLRIRKEASEEADILDLIAIESSLEVNKEADPVEGWVAVISEKGNGYVNAEYVSVATKYSTGITMEEEREAIAKEKAEKAGHKKGQAMSAGADEVTLLGAIIQCEAGSAGYEGMLAVGAVVVNRARRGYGGGSIIGVIYQPGQFPPATNGIMDGILARGVSASCMAAASDALAGIDNTGGATSFRPASSGYGGTVIGGNVFF